MKPSFIAGAIVATLSFGGVATFFGYLTKKQKNGDIKEYNTLIDKIKIILEFKNESQEMIDKMISVIHGSRNFLDTGIVVQHLNKILAIEDLNILIDKLEFYIVALDIIQDVNKYFN